MDWDVARTIADEAFYQTHGRHLTSVEIAILQGAWERQTYEDIADAARYSPTYLKQDVGPKLWRALAAAFGEKVSKPTFRSVIERKAPRLSGPPPSWPTVASAPASSTLDTASTSAITSSPATTSTPATKPSVSTRHLDWGEAPDVSAFYGRTEELKTLTQWLSTEHSRLVALLGMGGIGKSSLSVKLARQVSQDFDAIIWRSLRNAPYLDTVLSELVPLLAADRSETATVPSFLRCLREQRCLIVLDNLESILQAGNRAGSYRPGYEAYGDLLRIVGESSHRSCVVLTSREKPAEVSTFEGFGAVRSMTLAGSLETALALIDEKGLVGSPEKKQQLSHLYGCSPLALKIVSGSIETLFDGNIAEFLAEETLVFNGVRRLLDHQFERLAVLERSIMYWLAIDRDWTSLNDLAADMVPQVPRGKLLESLESLSSRALIERQGSRYTQQPVVMEYVADRLVQTIVGEIQTCQPHLLISHALTKTTLKEYIYSAQIRALVAPIALELEMLYGSHADIDAQLHATIEQLREIALSTGETPDRVASRQGYGAGNAIAIYRYLQIDMNGYDLSHLTIWQANFQGMSLQRANLQQADFSRCTFTQSFGSILSIALSPDGTLLAAGDDSGEIRVWQVAQTRSQHQFDSHLGQPILTCRGHDNSVRAVAFSPDGNTLVSCSSDQTIRLWDIASGHPLHALTGHVNSVYAIAVSELADRDAGRQVVIVSAGDDGTIRLWDLETGECWQEFQSHTAAARSVAWHPRDPLIASGGDDGTVRIWHIRTGACLQEMGDREGPIRVVAWHPDGTVVASAGDDRIVQVWQAETGQLLQGLHGHTEAILSVAFSCDGQTIASCGSDRSIRIWDSSTGQLHQVLQGHDNWVWGLAFGPQGRATVDDPNDRRPACVLASGSDDCTIKLWDTRSGEVLQTLYGYTNWIWSVAYHPHGNLLASGSLDGIVRLWDVAAERRVRRYLGHTGWIWSVAFHPDGHVLASGSDDGTIVLWETETGKRQLTLFGHRNPVRAIAWSPDGAYLASVGTDSCVRLWDTTTGDPLHVCTGHSGWGVAIAFSPDGRSVVSGSDDRSAIVWDVETGTLQDVLSHHEDSVRAVAYNPDGTAIATGSADGNIALWDARTSELSHILSGHNNWVVSLAFSPDGRYLASGSFDGTVRLWSTNDGTLLDTERDRDSWVQSVAFSPDNCTVASGGADASIRLWCFQSDEAAHIIRPSRPYEDSDFMGVTGLTTAQKLSLLRLGARETLQPGYTNLKPTSRSLMTRPLQGL